MQEAIDIDRIWWRNVRIGEFYNIERHHQIKGGGGSLYIEIPTKMVEETLKFLNIDNYDFLPITIEVADIKNPTQTANLTFNKKSGGRMRIVRQNRQQPHSERHPAWTKKNGFPQAPDTVSSSLEAMEFFPHGGLRIYIALSKNGKYYAGFTKGVRPPRMTKHDVGYDLYPDSDSKSSPPGGVIYA